MGKNNSMFGRAGKNSPTFGRKHTEAEKQKIRNNHANFTGKNHPNAKYTLWDIKSCHYSKSYMTRYNRAPNPCNCFRLKYNKNQISIGGFIDFYTPQLIYKLIEDFN